MKIGDIDFAKTNEFDLIVASCGYERRSSYLLRLGVSAPMRFAIEHGGTDVPQTKANRDLYSKAGWKPIEIAELLIALAREIPSSASRDVCVDITSMPRRTIAAIVEFFSTSDFENMRVTFAYCPAQFDSSSRAAERVQPLSAGPLSGFFTGALRPPSLPVGLILGLGLEPHRALGLVELVEPARTWAFLGESEDTRFAASAARLHKSLLEITHGDGFLPYDIRSLAQTYESLGSLVFSVGLQYRLLVAPSGPKIFTLACLLIGASREVARPAIWRVGGVGPAEPMDVEEAGDVVAAVVEF
ncbi:MAG: hypothetical protein KF867_03395 [Cryobacterium sp.]|nr:hypothetical protein [Cryobacterium sp.]